MKLEDYLLVKSLQKVDQNEIATKPGAVILELGDPAMDFKDQLLVLNNQRHRIYLDESRREHYVKEQHHIHSDPNKVLADCYDMLAVCVADAEKAHRGIDHFIMKLRQDHRFSDEEGIIQSGERLAVAFLDQLFRSQLYMHSGYFPYQFSRLVSVHPLLTLIK